MRACETTHPRPRRRPPPPPNARPVSNPSSEPPTGAAGFVFGAKRAVVKAVCTESGFEWSALARAKYKCGGVAKAVDLAEPTAELWFCRGALCGIFISGRPVGGTGWTATAVGLFESLVGKYGEPAERAARIPASCMKDEEASDCISQGQGSLRVSWAWPTAERIELFVGIPDGADGPVIQLTYTSPRSAPSAEGL